MEVKFLLNGDCALSVYFGQDINLETNAKVRMLYHELEIHPVEGIVETVPTYASLMIHYQPEIIRYRELVEVLQERMEHMGNVQLPAQDVIEIPVLYGGETGIDLKDCAKIEGMSVKEFIKVHSQSEYYIYMLGFAPGHPYSARFENPFHFQRRKVPRVKVAARSVVVSSNLSNILPFDQPCGWNIIGSTPVEICDYQKENPFLLNAGQWIKYVPITPAEYNKIRKEVQAGTYQCRRYEKVVK